MTKLYAIKYTNPHTGSAAYVCLDNSRFNNTYRQITFSKPEIRKKLAEMFEAFPSMDYTIETYKVSLQIGNNNSITTRVMLKREGNCNGVHYTREH